MADLFHVADRVPAIVARSNYQLGPDSDDLVALVRKECVGVLGGVGF